VIVSNSGVEAKDVTALAPLTHLRTLRLRSCPNVTDDVAAVLKGFAELETLDLHGCDKVTGTGLAELRALKNCGR
jgi:hypothetical protein